MAPRKRKAQSAPSSPVAHDDGLARLSTIETQISEIKTKVATEITKLNQAVGLVASKLDDLVTAAPQRPRLSVEPSGKVVLDVSGTKFTTSIATLTKEPSVLCSMFSAESGARPDSDGTYFIDRDPTHFGRILNYLRSTTHELDTRDMSDQQRVELVKEAEFYNLQSLITKLKPAPKPSEPGVANSGGMSQNSLSS